MKTTFVKSIILGLFAMASVATVQLKRPVKRLSVKKAVLRLRCW
jgi:hypothetical protein